MLVNIFPIEPGEGVRFGAVMLVAMLLLAFFSFLINKVFIRFSQKLGTNNYSASVQDRWSKMPKPVVGGLSFFLVFLLASQLGGIFGYYSSTDSQLLSLVIVAAIGFFVGLQDDAYNTRPLLKFLGQLSCGIVLVSFGLIIHLTHNTFLDVLLTLFWVVGIMNSINMLDNMDGVTASVSLIILAGTLTVNHYSGGEFGTIEWILLATIAALAGFLVLNYHPSKLYMGDTGSQFLGAILAFVGIKYLWNIQGINHEVVSAHQILYPILIFIVPIMDTTFVSIARIKRGQSPFVGGKDHTTHHLYYFGASEKLIPLIFSIITILSIVIVSTLRASVFQWALDFTLVAISYIVFIVLGMLFCYQKGAQNQKKLRTKSENINNNDSTLINAVLN